MIVNGREWLWGYIYWWSIQIYAQVKQWQLQSFFCLYCNSVCLYRDRQRWNEDYSHKLVTAWIRIPLQFWISYASWEVALHDEGCGLMFCNTYIVITTYYCHVCFGLCRTVTMVTFKVVLWRFLCNLIDRYLVLTLVIFLPLQATAVNWNFLRLFSG
jgi:hypothetical protein